MYIPAIMGHLPPKAVTTVRSFLDFCYIVRREAHDADSLTMIDTALDQFNRDRKVFRVPGVRAEGFSLPRQHSRVHYKQRIQSFGAPNGLCSSITESKHIKAVKEPWRRSNRFEALGQMLVTNQRLDKLAASRVQFRDRGMLEGSLLSSAQRALWGMSSRPRGYFLKTDFSMQAIAPRVRNPDRQILTAAARMHTRTGTRTTVLSMDRKYFQQ